MCTPRHTHPGGLAGGLIAVIGLAGAVACGATDLPPPTGLAYVVVENASQFVLEELRFHTGDTYLEAPNVLTAPLAVSSTTSYYLEGTLYVTVFRERARGLGLLALTTAQPLSLPGDRGLRVKVFDDAFRTVDEPFVPRSRGTDGGEP